MTIASRLRQRVQYAKASDGTRLAWAESGSGPVVVKAANWLTHLEYEWESPVWKHWIQFFSEHFRFVRFDERGCGMSEWKSGVLTVDQWVSDLETIIDAARPAEPMTLLGISQGAATCIAYAVRHPERVGRMILYGSYARGKMRRGASLSEREYRAMVELTRVGWGRNNPAFRQVFVDKAGAGDVRIPGCTHEQLHWFNELCLKTTTGDVAADLFEARAMMDVSALLE